jgi:hypothetical protein
MATEGDTGKQNVFSGATGFISTEPFVEELDFGNLLDDDDAEDENGAHLLLGKLGVWTVTGTGFNRFFATLGRDGALETAPKKGRNERNEKMNNNTCDDLQAFTLTGSHRPYTLSTASCIVFSPRS